MTGWAVHKALRLACVAFVVLSTASAVADADPDMPTNAAADAHRKQGNKFYRTGDFAHAIEEYKAGALIEDAAIFYYNLAQSYRFATSAPEKDPRSAIRNYKLYLSRGRVPERIAQSEQSIRELQPEADAADRLEREEAERARLQRAQQHESANPPAVPLQPSSPRWYSDGLGWTFAGAGVSGSLISGYLFLNAADLSDQANTEDRQEVRNELRDKATSRRTAGTAVGVASGALLIVAVVRLALVPDASPTTSSSVSVGVAGDGVFVFGRF